MAAKGDESKQKTNGKKQHNVPKLHLRYFTFDTKRIFVNCLQRDRNRIIRPNIDDICYEDYFYDGPADNGTPVDPS